MNVLLLRVRHPARSVLLVAAAILLAPLWAAAGDLYDWTGTWETSRGTMKLVQTGNSREGAEVAGTLVLKGAAAEQSIVAIVLGSRMGGTWSKNPTHRPPDDRGDIDLIMSDDRDSFTGAWRKGHGPEESGFEWRGKGDTKWDGKWSGKRVGAAGPAAPLGGKQTATAIARPNISGGGVFETATFTIGGTESQKVSVIQPAENFAIKAAGGGIVYQVIKGKSWGSLTLAPGTYVLSCNGGGAGGLMSASVSIECEVGGAAPILTSGEPTADPSTGRPKAPPGTGDGSKMVDPVAPGGRIAIRTDLAGGSLGGSVMMQAGERAQLSAWMARPGQRGAMRAVVVDRWSVGKARREMGSVDEKTGEFIAGPKEGDVVVTAAVGDITGTLRISVTSLPPVLLGGRVELFDDKSTPLPIPSGGVEVTVQGTWFESRDAYDQVVAQGAGISLGILGSRWTDTAGRFSFRMRAGGYMVLACSVNGSQIPAIPNHEWSQKLGGPNGMPSDLARWQGELTPGVIVPPLKPEGFPCLQLWLEEIPVTFSLGGVASHHGKPVRGAIVELRDGGTVVKKDITDYSGEYWIDVTGLPAGDYRLTARREPARPPPPPPAGTPAPPASAKPPAVTVGDWLYITKNIPINLPPQQEETTVDIKMISFAEKIGYKGP